MTSFSEGSESRLDRVEHVLAEASRIAASNARAIEALADKQAETRAFHEEIRARLAVVLEDLSQRQVGLEAILSKLNSMDKELDRLLESEEG